MGELHLEVIVDRLHEFNVDANIGQPQVAYKESIALWLKVREAYQADRRAWQYGHVILMLFPWIVTGFEFENRLLAGPFHVSIYHR